MLSAQPHTRPYRQHTVRTVSWLTQNSTAREWRLFVAASRNITSTLLLSQLSCGRSIVRLGGDVRHHQPLSLAARAGRRSAPFIASRRHPPRRRSSRLPQRLSCVGGGTRLCSTEVPFQKGLPCASCSLRSPEPVISIRWSRWPAPSRRRGIRSPLPPRLPSVLTWRPSASPVSPLVSTNRRRDGHRSCPSCAMSLKWATPGRLCS